MIIGVNNVDDIMNNRKSINGLGSFTFDKMEEKRKPEMIPRNPVNIIDAQYDTLKHVSKQLDEPIDDILSFTVEIGIQTLVVIQDQKAADVIDYLKKEISSETTLKKLSEILKKAWDAGAVK